jgi:general secretion pathway protein F
MLALEASSATEARLQAEMQGLQVLSLKSEEAWWKVFSLTYKTKQKFNVALFSQELLTLLESGLSLMESIEALSEKELQPQSQAVFRKITEALYEGLPFSMALEKSPEVFGPLYIAMIRASERTGDMPQTLRRHVNYQAQIDALRKKIISASIYPSLLLVVGSLVTFFLMGYVVPKFSGIYEMPWASLMLLEWGQLLQSHGREFVFAAFVFFALIVMVISRPQTRAWMMKKILQIPALGEAMRVYQLARFYRTLGMLLHGGISLTHAMQMVSTLLPANYSTSLSLSLADVKDGKPLSVAMENHQLTTSIATRMMRVGERTGQMDEMLERIGVFYDEETARKVEWLSKLIEPILMLIIGLVVGLVVVLMYMPIFELAGDIQ